jgi:hypothetical protein
MLKVKKTVMLGHESVVELLAISMDTIIKIN